ncbi:MAG: acyl-CoA dehydratase activase-related protein, partial [Bacillota bacterium]
VTFEMIDDEVIDKELQEGFPDKKMFWEFTNKLAGAGYHFLKSDEIDGVIYITAFGCGPDSILGPFLDIDADEYNKPFMTLRIDEQTGESHLVTRVEAFIDLLRLQKDKENGGVTL